MFGAADHVVEQAFAHRGFADAHVFKPERGKARFKNCHAAGDDRGAITVRPGSWMFSTLPQSSSASRSFSSEVRLMPESHQPAACTMLPIERAVPEEPIASPQPNAR